MKEFGVIYKIVNTINGKIYIGQTTNASERKNQHERCCMNKNNNKLLYKAMRKYGVDNFLFSVIEKCYNRKELNEMEYHYIIQYRTYVEFENCNGYNMTMGDQSCGISEETKRKISESQKTRFTETSVLEHNRYIQKIAQNRQEVKEKKSKSGKISQNLPHVRLKREKSMQELFSRQEVINRMCKAQQSIQNRLDVRKKKSKKFRIVIGEQTYIVDSGLKRWCAEHNIKVDALRYYINKDIQYKGMLIYRD
jgi:group I intron endonuclease